MIFRVFVLTLLAAAASAQLKMNDLQVMGTHNSYHVANHLSSAFVPSVDYTHCDINEQLTGQKIRGLEFDLWLKEDGTTDDFKVYHDPLDPDTNCEHLSECLGHVKTFTGANADHHYVLIVLELKDTETWTIARIKAVEAAVESALGAANLIKPDDLMGSTYGSVKEAAEADNWPTLASTKGKYVVYIQGFGSQKETVIDNYLGEYSNLTGASFFLRCGADDPANLPNHCAFVSGVSVDTQANKDQVKALAEAGFIVRGRSDEDARQSGSEYDTNDRTRLDALVANGAHFIYTDFPAPSSVPGDKADEFWAELETGTPAVCNTVVLDGASCTQSDIEDASADITVELCQDPNAGAVSAPALALVVLAVLALLV